MPKFIIDNHLYYNPVEFVIDTIGGTYKMPILWRLKDKNWRYSELKKSMSHVSDRMLSKALKELEQDELIAKEIFAEVPIRTEYSLREKGRQCIPIIESIRELGLEWLGKIES
ncbi:MAG: helix-turn-helix domain-containing protein [Candidatus Kapaibacterium sp.]